MATAKFISLRRSIVLEMRGQYNSLCRQSSSRDTGSSRRSCCSRTELDIKHEHRAISFVQCFGIFPFLVPKHQAGSYLSFILYEIARITSWDGTVLDLLDSA